MLTLQNVGSSQDAGHYYEKADDYYTQDKSPSRWEGEGAKALGLSGEVNIEDFKPLVDGILPNGETIKMGAEGRRGGTDLTFSAPKSLSMQAFIGNDLRLIDAHDQAVARTLKYAENLVMYRQMKQGETQSISSNNFVVATFRHELSRACDPQLHTHSVVLNMTQREDGKWRAIDNKLFYRQKMLMGAFYRAELAREVQKLGYEVRITRFDGLFELAHFTEQQLDQFSQRSNVIEEALAKNGKTRETATAQEKQIIAIATRQKKTEVDRKLLKEYWQEKSLESKIDYSLPTKKAIQGSNLYLNSRLNLSAVEAVEFAVNHSMERQSVVSGSQIEKLSLQAAVGKATYKEIKEEIERRIKEGLFIQSVQKNENQEFRYTTPEAIQREKTILSIERRGRGKTLAPLLQQEAQSFLEKKELNEGQRQAIELILTSSNRIIGVQGLAGTRKTSMLPIAREIAEKQNYKMIGVAPSAAAALELSKTGIKSQTIASFQSTKEKNLDSKTILVIDEAGMVSTKQMESLLKTAERYGSRVVLMGDTQQLKAVEAGRPFAQLQANDMAAAGMSEIQRQKNPELKKAVELAAIGQISQSVALMDKQILEITEDKDRYARIAKDYTTLSQEEREGTLLVSGTNEARKTINENVRENLGLNGKGKNIQVLVQKDFTLAQIKQTRSYSVGDFIKPGRNYDALGMKKEQLYQVEQIQETKIILKNLDGLHVEWDPRKRAKVGVYTIEKREMATGDLVRITQNDREKGLVNGDRAKVLEINEKIIKIQREDKTIFELKTENALHIEHGYCSTVHSAQGKTCERVFIDGDTRSLTSAQDTYYVAISRARQEARIYTNDKEKLPKAMGRENVKEVALELNCKPERQQFEQPRLEINKVIQLAKEIELNRS